MQDKISLAGDLGSGKSTVSSILIQRLGAEYYHTGAIVRSVAEKHGMSVVELNIYMETHPEIDTEIDDGLRALSEVDKFLIIDSRMAWHFTKGTFKVYLSTDVQTSAYRIMNANRTGEHAKTLEDTVKDTLSRRASEKKRYLEMYGVDIKDLTNYDLVVDTTYITPEEVADIIIDGFHRWQRDKSYKALYIAAERLNFPNDAPSGDVDLLSVKIERGESVQDVVVTERDGEFYVLTGAESALAYSFNMDKVLPARLVSHGGEIDRTEYVKMKNSL